MPQVSNMSWLLSVFVILGFSSFVFNLFCMKVYIIYFNISSGLKEFKFFLLI